MGSSAVDFGLLAAPKDHEIRALSWDGVSHKDAQLIVDTVNRHGCKAEFVKYRHMYTDGLRWVITIMPGVHYDNNWGISPPGKSWVVYDARYEKPWLVLSDEDFQRQYQLVQRLG